MHGTSTRVSQNEKKRIEEIIEHSKGIPRCDFFFLD